MNIGGWRCSRVVVQNVELNLILIPEVADCQATLQHIELIMDCAILLTTARHIVATAILIHIRLLFESLICQNNKLNNINMSKQEIIGNIYFDKAGFGFKNTTLKDAREKNKSITMKDVE